jgi:hypothetical protein
MYPVSDLHQHFERQGIDNFPPLHFFAPKSMYSKLSFEFLQNKFAEVCKDFWPLPLPPPPAQPQSIS